MLRALAAAALACLVLLPAAGARADSAADAEALARGIYVDGFPAEQARALDTAGVARLAELLADPTEAAVHANALLLLGASGHPDAFAAIAGYAASAPQGEVGRDRFRALSRVPLALGRLASSDARALAWLDAALARGAQDPGWGFGHQRGERLALLLEEHVLTGLALSGRPEAAARLASPPGLRAAGVAATRRERHLAALRALHARVAEEGVDAALASPFEAPQPRAGAPRGSRWPPSRSPRAPCPPPPRRRSPTSTRSSGSCTPIY
jgi:hypothetical protein